jgi:hypothetical protein
LGFANSTEPRDFVKIQKSGLETNSKESGNKIDEIIH